MFGVAKKRAIEADLQVEANTSDWRRKVRAELDKRPRGERAKLADHLGISTGHLSETLADDEDASPDQKRYTRHRRKIDEYLWPPLLPLSGDTLEVRYLLEGIDRDLLKVIKEMDRDTQRKWAEVIIATRKPK